MPNPTTTKKKEQTQDGTLALPAKLWSIILSAVDQYQRGEYPTIASVGVNFKGDSYFLGLMEDGRTISCHFHPKRELRETLDRKLRSLKDDLVEATITIDPALIDTPKYAEAKKRREESKKDVKAIEAHIAEVCEALDAIPTASELRLDLRELDSSLFMVSGIS